MPPPTPSPAQPSSGRHGRRQQLPPPGRRSSTPSPRSPPADPPSSSSSSSTAAAAAAADCRGRDPALRAAVLPLRSRLCREKSHGRHFGLWRGQREQLRQRWRKGAKSTHFFPRHLVRIKHVNGLLKPATTPPVFTLCGKRESKIRGGEGGEGRKKTLRSRVQLQTLRHHGRRRGRHGPGHYRD